MEQQIVNRVANSSLLSIDLDEYIDKSEREYFDLKDCLFQGLILREKEFRAFVREFNWERFKDKNVAIGCSTDAIIPSWAYMLVVSKIQPLANELIVGSIEDLDKVLIDQAIAKVIEEGVDDKPVVIKGCGNSSNRDYAYGQIAKKLIPKVKSLMYGEPCSTVPVYKRPK